MPFLERTEVMQQWAQRIALGFAAADSRQAAEAFHRAGVDYVLWTSADAHALWAPTVSLLRDPRYFEMDCQQASSSA